MQLCLYLYAPYLCIYVYVYVYVYVYAKVQGIRIREGGRGQRGVVDRGVGEQRGAGGARVQEGALYISLSLSLSIYRESTLRLATRPCV
jgi:hypothetical protein